MSSGQGQGRRKPQAVDPVAALQSMLPGLAWSQAMIESAGRAQAKLAAEALRKLNAPVVDALARQRELVKAMEETARQLATLAENVQLAARQYADITDGLQAALDPYLRYVDWLGAAGAGRTPESR